MYIYLYDTYTSLEAPLKTEQLLFKQFSRQIANKIVNRKNYNKINITVSDKINIISYRDRLLIPKNSLRDYAFL